MMLLSLILLACSSGDEENIAVKPLKVMRTVEVVESPATTGSDVAHKPIQVTLSFEGISNLHRGFFMQNRGVQALGQSLGACFSDSVTVEVSYSNEDLRGRILLVSTMEAMKCQPLMSKEALVLEPWVPIGKSLAAFRDYVAGTSDFRISNFQVGLRVEHENGSCTWMIAGQNPPDGSLWDGCVTFNDAATCVAQKGVSPQHTFPWSRLNRVAEIKECL